MREKRKLPSSSTRTLVAGERLNRNRLLVESDIRWNWIGTSVKHMSEITKEHCLRAAGLTISKSRPLCQNKYSVKSLDGERTKEHNARKSVTPKDDGDIIVISDDEDRQPCEKKKCKDNPFCLNYLGQQKWENEADAFAAFAKAEVMQEDPTINSRDLSLPVGLKNLGATCYANAFLQVWFQDLPFRSGVYRCQPTSDNVQQFKESPIFQLQVTFGALQEGNMSVFNPVKLVESLRLRTTEQQDAQEFSKLFMTHLDDEFKKQSNPELKHLLSNLFEGKMIYATVCDKCKSRSEREATFLELEVNLEDRRLLEDRIGALLAPERLSADNKYLCSVCESLEDATRYVEIHTLPPVLHISLLRFVYDTTTYERRKSKSSLKFPPYLNMTPFLRSSNSMDLDSQRKDSEMYELRGVLLHKGQSAYHGHYEAQVFHQAAKTWYQFNDDIVTLLPMFHFPQKAAASDDEISSVNVKKEKPAKRQRTGAKIRKITDSDNNGADTSSSSSAYSKYLSSKDAYMLVYARKDNPNEIESTSISPPKAVLEVVESLNRNHEKECEEYRLRVASTKDQFADIRRKIMDIYRSWTITSVSDPSIVVSRTALEKLLGCWFTSTDDAPGAANTGPIRDQDSFPEVDSLLQSTPTNIKAPVEDNTGSPFRRDVEKAGSLSSTTSHLHTIDSSQLLCKHGRLNPFLDKEMKIMSKIARDKILQCGFTFSHEFTVDDVCDQCVDEEFMEKLYQISHPQLTSQFAQINKLDTEAEGYWISKNWLKDWQLDKPKMHVRCCGDPPPDGPDYFHHVKCEHNSLSLNTSTRQRISHEAVQLLKELYPSWQPPEWNAEICPICNVMAHISKESKQEQRKNAETEKALLPRLQEDCIFGINSVVKDTPCAIVPAEFIHSWRSWLLKPGTVQRPDSVDNSFLICEHGKLVIDLSNAHEFDEDLAVVTEGEWEILKNLYDAGPLILVHNTAIMSKDGDEKESIVFSLDYCDPCRIRSKLNFASTSLSIIQLKSDDEVPITSTNGSNPRHISDLRVSFLTSGDLSSSGKPNGTRQSRRLKEGKSSRRHQLIQVNKQTSVKDMKVAIQKAFRIPTISQRLYYRGKELDENTQSVAALEILDRDVLYLKEVEEDVLELDNDIDEVSGLRHVKTTRNEGAAFRGTLLSDSMPIASETGGKPDRGRGSPIVSVSPTEKACPACTFYNSPESTNCLMCMSSLI